MTRKTFQAVAAALLLSAVVASPVSQAYFPVSLPAGTLTMSGTYYAEPAGEPAAKAPSAHKHERAGLQDTRTVRPEPSSVPRKQRASAGAQRATAR